MPTILLAQEDQEASASLTALLCDFFPTLEVELLTDFPTLIAALEAGKHATLLLADVFWNGQNQSGSLLLLAESHPELSIGLVSRFDLTGCLPPAFPLPCLKPDDQLPLQMAELMEDFSGRNFGSYTLLSPAGPHPLGRLYWAKHHQLERQVQVLIPPAGSPHFSKAIRNYARLNHASVYSLYESIPHEERVLVALEPVIHRSFLHRELDGEKPDLISCARLASALGSVLAEMESSSIPARLLDLHDYTLSPKGTPRLRNPAAYPGAPEASYLENSNRLAAILEPVLPESPSSTKLLQILRDPGTSAFDLLRRTRDFEHQLADVQEVRVRQEEIEAKQKALQARIRRRWALILGGLGAIAFATLSAWVCYDRLLLDLPGKLANEEIPVPSGRLAPGDSASTIPAFQLDRHEVTIGQYETFLKELQSEPNWKTFLPPGTAASKKEVRDLAPVDWSNIIAKARKGDKYNGQIPLTRDTPVFGVDYPSAYAFAKWRKRRLPSKSEWIRAATGNDYRSYPWGKNPSAPNINLGINRAKIIDPNTYFHVLPSESVPEDTGPFQHRDLGGNLSEWIASPDPLVPLYIGGNFLDEAPVDNQNAVRSAPQPIGYPSIGFRTAK